MAIVNASAKTTGEKRVAKFFGLTGDAWMRHANPWSVWTRFTCVSLIALAAWSRTWIGWYCLIPVAAALLWTVFNPRLFGVPSSTRSWASRGVFGERGLRRSGDEPDPGAVCVGHPERGECHFRRSAWPSSSMASSCSPCGRSSPASCSSTRASSGTSTGWSSCSTTSSSTIGGGVMGVRELHRQYTPSGRALTGRRSVESGIGRARNSCLSAGRLG